MTSVQTLAESIEAARRTYYNNSGEYVITDAEYDALEEELRRQDPGNALFKQVGVPVNTTPWKKVEHMAPMGSLNKVQDEEELHTWINKVGDGTKLVVSEKLDGISISLRYDKGVLVQAVTRGDGTIGEDITRNVRKMGGVPEVIGNPFTGHIRGEIVLLKSDHQKYFKEYANPRNTASGVAKRLSGEGCENLTVICYQAVPSNNDRFTTKIDEFLFLTKSHFRTPNTFASYGLGTTVRIYEEYIESRRNGLDYDIDGLVVEVNDLVHAHDMGEHDGKPKAAVAFKFPHATGKTILRQVDWQVGNTGRLTPVAIFDPVKIAGAEISRASLYNHGYISKLDLHIGDEIEISRRNDVIPRVERVLKVKGTSSICPPNVCTNCAEPTATDGEYVICPNPGCNPAGALKRWIQGLGILGWGDALIEAIVESGLAETPADLYKLTKEQLANLEIGGHLFGDIMAAKVLGNLYAGNEQALDVVVGSLGIPNCQRTFCKMLVEAGLDTFDKMLDASLDRLTNVPGVGDTKAHAFRIGIRNVAGIYGELLKNGLIIKQKAVGSLTGKSFCFTGFRDKALEKDIEAAGGVIKGSVVKGLYALIVMDVNSNSSKLTKARSQGTLIISAANARASLGL